MSGGEPQQPARSAAYLRRRFIVALMGATLAAFTLTGAARFEGERRAAIAAETERAARAAAIAAEGANAALAHGWGVLAGAGDLAQASDGPAFNPQAIVTAASRARALAGAALLTPDGKILAIAATDREAASSETLARAARGALAAMRGEPNWSGLASQAEGPPVLAAGRRIGQAVLVGVFDTAALMGEPPGNGALILAAPDGGVLGAKPSLPAREGRTLAGALGVSESGPVGTRAVFRDRTLAGAPIAVGSAALSTGGLRVYASAPATPMLSILLSLAPLFCLMFLAPVIGAGALLRLWVKQAERAEAAEIDLAATQNRFRLAVDGAQAGVFEWRLDTDQIELSSRIAELLNAPDPVVRFDVLLSLIAPEDRASVEESFTRARTDGVLETSFRVRTNGGTAWIEARGLAIEDPARLGSARLVGTAIDVTPRREAQARAAALERRLREAIDSYSGPFALWDARKRLAMWNRSFAKFFNMPATILRPGAPYDAITAQAMKEVHAARPDPSDPQIQEMELKTGMWLQMVERRTAEGGLVTVGADITALKRQEEAVARSQRNLRSMVTQLEHSEARNKELAKKYEEEKRRAEEASRAKSAFLANMSHELRTPLNAINGFSELMASELFGPLGDKRYQEYSKDILASGQLLLDLINDILDMAKIEAGKITLSPHPLDPIEAVDQAMRLMRRRFEEKQLSLIVDGANVPEIEADHRAVKQMLLNLLSNAVKFTAKGGVMVRVRAHETGVSLAVIDTGAGIPAAHLPRLARPFEQVDMELSKKTGGTGLGLALTKSLAEMHGGRLTIESEFGRGTIVTIFLPYRLGGGAALPGAAMAGAA